MHESAVVDEPPEHTQPDSILDQSEDQPSLLFEFPSSHFSDPTFLPSPHWVTQVVGLLTSF